MSFDSKLPTILEVEVSDSAEQSDSSDHSATNPTSISSKSEEPPQEQPAQAVADDKSSVPPTKPSSAPTSTPTDSKIASKPNVKTAHQLKHVFGAYGRMKTEWHEAMKQVLAVHGER
ncbi:hypothetical protein NEUTE1DRAFT_51270 [Neurospora tetrasperma FGSC 2508]|uniref:Uncharacterized protein n=2 Tax=Neurospora TaxID=5140 RepID=A0AAJ0IE17_9PEZI|nr:uncharacterized protein NEUTE1DRAFT_51270 [Neurospora tetrasperma FGSC 2508]EGO53743.1 hypothetical protein NEUTE1DRAFT_51270 [Neurospora tetrasperma FGSC 2508]EGZ76177.1 hypothetical protein NEUTE2DRAFT_122836 [Neurospora tetrasperma FGSC 2509]KAK3498016.1 hypothetical protein B0T23DRAFT_99306 [Neurospora hispaniola]